METRTDTDIEDLEILDIENKKKRSSCNLILENWNVIALALLKLKNKHFSETCHFKNVADMLINRLQTAEVVPSSDFKSSHKQQIWLFICCLQQVRYVQQGRKNMIFQLCP